MSHPTPNRDESIHQPDIPFIGNFHKTLPHNEFGEVCPIAYRQFMQVCIALEAGETTNFEHIPTGISEYTNFEKKLDPQPQSTAKFTNPLAGAATELHGIDPQKLDMLPAPEITSASTAAEMVELYWMAQLRDVCFAKLNPNNVDLQIAIDEIKKAYQYALDNDKTDGKVRLGLDLPQLNQTLHIDESTVFRSGLKDEEHGPLVSQFFLNAIPYGTQTIDQTQFPYVAKKDFLTNYCDWLHTQNTGKDKYGRDYSTCNHYSDQCTFGETYYEENKRIITTMRDLARFVNRDALHQAYFNAALFLDAIGAPLDAGNPYAGNIYAREGGFVTLGGPDLLTLVSEVANRVMKVVWRQKWLVHRRCRPEVYGGLLHVQELGAFNDANKKRKYYLHKINGLSIYQRIKQSNQAQNKRNTNNECNGETLLLPMAFSAGSPTHPAYGAGHATVAGACVTVLKAWFDEDQPLQDIYKNFNSTTGKEPKQPTLRIIEPCLQSGLVPIGSTQAKLLTVGGELNKIASNVAMGRSMGGVHWRTDNTRSLRLGETIAIEILRKRTVEYAEKPVSFTLTSFDRRLVKISQGQVSIDGVIQPLP